LLRGKGVKAGLLKLDTIWPVPYHEIRALSEQCDVIFAVEMNIGKYAGEIERVVFGRCEVERIGKNRGLIHTVGEIVNGIEKKMGVRTW
jgi:2-oxoglutarate ferredoxin oxidoreductase subunit alpha